MADVRTSARFFDGKDVFWAGVVFFLSYAFYLLSAYPTVTTEDSGEFAAAAYTLGIAHPSGYPLYVILAKIFTLLVPFGNIAWRVNIFSAFFAAATVAGIYLLLKLLTKDTAIGVIGSLLFAGGEIFRSQAIRAEVYSLNSFFLVLLLILAVVWFQHIHLGNQKFAEKILLWIAFLYGLSLTNHHLMLMAGPPLLFFIIYVQPKILLNYKLIIKVLLLVALGLSLYLYLPIRASYKPEVNWGNPVTWQSFWDHVTRRAYDADALNAMRQPIYFSETSAANSFTDFFRYHVFEFSKKFGVMLDQNYSWIIGLLALPGFVFLWKKSRKIFWFFITLVIFHTFVLSSLLGLGFTGKLPVRLFIDRPFYIGGMLITVILAGCGIRYVNYLYYLQGKRTAPAHERKKAVWAWVVIMVIILAWRFPQQNQSNNYLAHDLAKASLAVLPPDAVLHSENGDNTIFPVLYLQKVEKFRPDVNIYVSMPDSIYPFFINLEKTISQNSGKRIFTDFPFIFYPDKDYAYYGPVAEIVNPGAEPDTSKAVRYFENIPLRGMNNVNLDHFHRYLKARYFLDLGLAHGKNPDIQDENFRKAFEAAPESRNITGQLVGNYYARTGLFEKAVPYLETAQKLMPDEYPINFQLAVSYLLTGQSGMASDLMASLKPEDRALLLKELALFSGSQPGKYPQIERFLESKP